MELLKFIRLVDLKENDFAVSISSFGKLTATAARDTKNGSQIVEKPIEFGLNKTTLCEFFNFEL